jgi:hypothetical protein
MTATARNIESIPKGARRNIYVEFTDQLIGADVLSGTPTVTEVVRSEVEAGTAAPSTASNGFTVDNEGRNAAAYTNQIGETVAVSKAVAFRAATTSVAVGRYAFKVSVATSNASSETLLGYVLVDVTGS